MGRILGTLAQDDGDPASGPIRKTVSNQAQIQAKTEFGHLLDVTRKADVL